MRAAVPQRLHLLEQRMRREPPLPPRLQVLQRQVHRADRVLSVVPRYVLDCSAAPCAPIAKKTTTVVGSVVTAGLGAGIDVADSVNATGNAVYGNQTGFEV